MNRRVFAASALSAALGIVLAAPALPVQAAQVVWAARFEMASLSNCIRLAVS